MLPALKERADALSTMDNQLTKLFRDMNEFLKSNFEMVIHATAVSLNSVTFNLYDVSYGEKPVQQPPITATVDKPQGLKHPILYIKSATGRFRNGVYCSGIPAVVATVLFAASQDWPSE